MKGYQPEVIRVDNLLNILWLSNPSIANNDLSDIGLSSSISLTLSQNLPKAKVLKQLNENIYRYGKDNISDENIIRISHRITTHQLKQIEALNVLAEKDNQEFINKLNEEANKQREIEEKTKYKRCFEFFCIKSEKYQRRIYEDKSTKDNDMIESLQSKVEELENKMRNSKIEDYKNKELKKWQNKNLRKMLCALGLILNIYDIFIIFKQMEFHIFRNNVERKPYF